mgnify:CR=1 FL=1
MAGTPEYRPFGAEGKYSSQPAPRLPSTGAVADSKEAELVRRLLAGGGAEIRNRVTNALKRWDPVIREQLRNETALRLTAGPRREPIRVVIADGLPRPFAELVSATQNPILWWLAYEAPRLRLVGQVLSGLPAWLDEIRLQFPELRPPIGTAELEATSGFAAQLADAAGQLQLRDRLRNIDEDVLGTYFFRRPEIHLYWMVIGIMASVLDCRPEDLTFVVLTHELAHAYTHRGYDIDNVQWSTDAFSAADERIVEGLAQFYTLTVCEKVADRYPYALEAYHKLLEYQGGPYRVHEEWLQRFGRAREVLRAALIGARSKRIAYYEDFEASLDEIAGQLRRPKPPRPTPVVQQDLPMS